MTDVSGLLWLGIFGFVAASCVVGLVLVRKAPPLTTQRNQVTGMKEHGILTWGACFYGLLWGLPWGTAAILEHPLVAAIAFPFVIAGGAYGWLKWRERRRTPAEPPAPQPFAPAFQAGPTHVPYVPTQANTYADPDAYLTPFYLPVPDTFWKRPDDETVPR